MRALGAPNGSVSVETYGLLVDNLVQTLQSLAGTDDPMRGWTITNNGVVIAVKAISNTTFDTPADALGEAQRMIRELTTDGVHKIVNRAELAATISPIEDDGAAWRGKVDVLLWPTNLLDEDHCLIDVP